MAIKKESLQKIAALAKIKVEDLEVAIKDDKEVEITIDEKLSTFSETEVETLKDNEYKRGKTAGVEMAVKEVKEKQNLDFQGRTIEGLLEAHKKHVLTEAKIEPAQKVLELETKITTLQKTVGDYENQLAEKDQEVTGVKINGELYKHIPALGENGPALGADDVIQLMKANGYEFKFENGTTVAYKEGKQLADKLGNAIPSKDVVSGFLKDKKLITDPVVPGGRGGTDQKPGARPMKLSEIKKQFEDQKKSLLGSEFSEAVAQATKDNKDFDMNS